MSYDARVFNVMIASPSDVALEREIVREVIYDWNAVHSEEKSMVLLPVRWESHTSPEMGDRAQAIINRQTVDKCDLLVGIFGTRLGTDTGKYPSGTIEEIEDHIKSGRPAMVYFSNQLGDSGNFEAEQYTELMKWKEYYRSRGLCESYDNDTDFKDKFFRQLQIKVNQHEIFQFQDERIDSDFRREESESNIPQLSDTAKILLKEASQSDTGSILHCGSIDVPTFRINGQAVPLYHESIDGDAILINDKNIIPNQRPRVVAEWIAALQELVETSLLGTDSRAYNQRSGTSYRVTLRGYQVADMIEDTT